MTMQAPSMNCLELRGQDGKWVHDEQGYKYPVPEFIPKNELTRYFGPVDGIAPRTQWTWEDSSPQCQTQLFSREGFCNLMVHLDLQRIFFIGDSLTFQQLRSFWQLMSTEGHRSIIQHQTRKNNPSDWGGPETKYLPFKSTIDCGEGGGEATHILEVVFKRTDDLRADLAMEEEELYHQNWLKPYLQSTANTLLVANTGMHTPDQEAYQSDLDTFVETVHSLNRPRDVIAYRSSVPGHANCMDHKQPFGSIGEFQHPDLYQWGNIDGYNQYTRHKLQEVGRSSGGVDGGLSPYWVYLDVYPMTILRPDGHKSPNRDCVHYILPGPPDWWNHLMFSNLLDLAQSKGQAVG